MYQDDCMYTSICSSTLCTCHLHTPLTITNNNNRPDLVSQN